jgi:hypothetical protein
VPKTRERQNCQADTFLDLPALREAAGDLFDGEGFGGASECTHDRGRLGQFVASWEPGLHLLKVVLEGEGALTRTRHVGLASAATLLVQPRALGVRAKARDLVVRAQPAGFAAARFFECALFVEGDQLLEDFFVGQCRRPAVGLEHERIELVVQLLEDEDEALVLDALVLRRPCSLSPSFDGERVRVRGGSLRCRLRSPLSPRAGRGRCGTQLFEHVVHLRQREPRGARLGAPCGGRRAHRRRREFSL